MTATKDVVGDSTDPKGTLRPNLPQETAPGKAFTPMECPEFDHEINTPSYITTPFQFWDLLFDKASVDSIVLNANKKGAKKNDRDLNMLLTHARE